MRRYASIHGITSPLDPIKDVLVLLEYLTSHDYLIQILTATHGLTPADAKRRASSIIPHMRSGLAFIEQSLSTTPDLSFLPAYYGLLNLIKAYILVGPHHADLPANRWHGASYPVDAKDSRTLLTEVVDIKRGGAIPLLYRTVTGKVMPVTRLQLQDFYPFVSGVTAEYSLAVGKPSLIRSVRLGGMPHKKYKKKQICTATIVRHQGETQPFAARDFKVLSHFRPAPEVRDTFCGRVLPNPCQYDDPRYRRQFHTYMVYGFDNHVISTPMTSQRVLMFEELPILLLFFHMGSVVRYKPEFMNRVRNSRYWPILAAARQHSLLRFLILTWSFIHNRQLEISHRLN